MTSLWLLPVAVALAGATAVVLAATRSAEEAGRLGQEYCRLTRLGPLLLEIREAAAALTQRASSERRDGISLDPGERSPT